MQTFIIAYANFDSDQLINLAKCKDSYFLCPYDGRKNMVNMVGWMKKAHWANIQFLIDECAISVTHQQNSDSASSPVLCHLGDFSHFSVPDTCPVFYSPSGFLRLQMF